MDSRYLVVGLGKTGLSVARYLHRNNKNFMVFDTRKDVPDLALFKKEFPRVSVYLQTVPDDLLNQLTDIIMSPGLAPDLPFLKTARLKNISIYGDVECLAREISAPVVAITGTNGKSTVTTLVGEMAKAAGFQVAVAGNIGSCVLDNLNDGNQYDLWVLELSSFQLDLTFSLKPTIGCILNVTSDHLDRHHTLAHYIQSKHRVYQGAQMALFNRDDQSTIPQADSLGLKSISFGQDHAFDSNWGLIRQENAVFLAKGRELLLDVASLPIKGVHNWMNALASAALASAVGVPLPSIIEVLQSFSGLPHRCQWVRTIEGVDWINDSKGTNIGATISAINGIGGSMSGKIVLIAGGLGKGADFKELCPAVADFVRSAILIGQDADKIEAVLADVVPTTRANTLEMAVLAAKSFANAGDVVLLSPACASFDMFTDFNHRGEVFISLVNGL